MTSHNDTATGEKKPSLLDKIIHPGGHKHDHEHKAEHAEPHNRATTDAPETRQGAFASPNGTGKHAVVSAGNEDSPLAPGMNLGAHGAY